ncbi:hypothetical protein M8402_09805, partial [Staphylococcus aureus]|uniref:hypothetical protein n=1 Tax=Staphylococcus aureus TaxID=1280 RepID=UPI000A248F89
VYNIEETRPTILKEVYLYRIFKDIHNIALCYFASYFILTSKKKTTTNHWQSFFVSGFNHEQI